MATPARRDACATHLTPRRLGFYLNEVGLFAMNAGDLATARDYLTLAVRHGRDAGDMRNLAARLLNLADCLGRLGQAGPAREAAAEALTMRRKPPTTGTVSATSHAYLGWLAGLAGDTTSRRTPLHHRRPDLVHRRPDGEHLYSFAGVLWAQWLGRTGRPGPAQYLTRRNADISRKYGWNENLARCDQILGGLALAAGDTVTASTHLTAAVAAFRDGDYLTELADALPSLAACAQATGDLDTAERHAGRSDHHRRPPQPDPRPLPPPWPPEPGIRAAQATATGDT